MRNRLLRLLRWSEKYTKTDMVYLASGGFWLTLEQIFFGLIALAVSVAFARLVPAATYGTYRYLLSVFWTLTALSFTGVPTVLSRAIAREEGGAYREALSLMLVGTLPMSLIAGGIAFYYFYLGNTALALGALVICVLGPMFQASYLFSAVLEGKRDFRRSMIFGVILNAIPALALLALMPFVRTPLPFFAAYLAINVLTAAALSIATARLYPSNGVKSPAFKNLSWHLSAANIIGTVATQADQLLVFHFIGPASLAVYAFATSLPDQIKNAVTNLSNIAFPKYAARSPSEIKRSMAERIAILTLGIAVLILIYFFLAPLFFRILFPTYLAAVPYSRVYAITLIAVGSLIPTTALQAQAAKRELYAFNIVSGVVQIAVMLAGVIWYGLMGLIIARGISRLFNLVSSYALVNSYAKRASSGQS